MEKTEPTKFETLLGGTNVEVKFANGETDTVRVHQLSVAQFPTLLAVLDDEAKSIELYTAKESGWSGLITPTSHEQLISEGERLNADFFGRWVQRRMQRQEKLMPGFTDRLIKQAGATSPTS